MPYFDKRLKSQVLPGVHFDSKKVPSHVVNLPSSNIAFKKIPAWHELTYDADGVPNGSAEIVKSNDVKISAFRAMVGEYIDSAARSAGPFGFDNIISAVSYADDLEDTVNQPHGAALKVFRRECWDVARLLLSEWKRTGIEPSVSDVINSLPVYSMIE